jgi:hypothetical protein
MPINGHSSYFGTDECMHGRRHHVAECIRPNKSNTVNRQPVHQSNSAPTHSIGNDRRRAHKALTQSGDSIIHTKNLLHIITLLMHSDGVIPVHQSNSAPTHSIGNDRRRAHKALTTSGDSVIHTKNLSQLAISTPINPNARKDKNYLSLRSKVKSYDR